GTSTRDPAALRRVVVGLRQIRRRRSLVTDQSQTRARFETASLLAQTRARSRLRRWIFFVYPERSWSFRSRPRPGSVPAFHRVTSSFRRRPRCLEDQSARAAARSRSKIRLDHGILHQFQSSLSGKATLGVSGMGFFSARFAAPSRPGRQNLFRTQPHLRWWLLYARAARSFSKEGRRSRARTNFFRERITLLAYAAVARTDARTNVLARFLCRR